MAKHGTHDNAPAAAPVTSLRGWLDHLAEHDRLAVIRPGMGLRFELAAIAKRLDGEKATFFPRPGGHAIPIVSGLLGDARVGCRCDGGRERRGAQAFQRRRRQSLALARGAHGAAAGGGPRRGGSRPSVADPDPQRARQRALYQRRPDDLAQPAHGCPERRHPPLPVERHGRARRLLLPRHTLAFYEAAEEAGEALEIAIVIGVDPLTALRLAGDRAARSGRARDRRRLARRAARGGQMPDQRGARAGRGRDRARGPHPAAPARARGPVRRVPAILRRARRAPRRRRSTAITHRRDAIFHTIVGGGQRAPPARRHPARGDPARPSAPQLSRACSTSISRWAASAATCFTCKLRKRQEGEAKNVIMGAFAGHYDVKQVVVVDRGRRHPQSARSRMGGGDALPGRPGSVVIVADSPGLEARSVGARTASARRWASTRPCRSRRRREIHPHPRARRGGRRPRGGHRRRGGRRLARPAGE